MASGRGTELRKYWRDKNIALVPVVCSRRGAAAIVRHWTQILRPGGWLMFEVGEDQADAVMALMTEEKYTDVTALEDTAGIRRVVVGRI